MSLLRIRKPGGSIVEIASLPGAKGADGYTPVKGVDYFTPKEQAEFTAAVIAYTDQKTAPANSMNYGTVKAWTDSDVAEIGGGIYMDEEGYLRLVSASEANIDMRLHTAPITPQNLDYAVKSVGDGYYAKVGETGSSITVDQEYSPDSENAQSGKAVAQALAGVSGDGGTDEWELVEEITVSEEAVVERRYDTPFKKIVVLFQSNDNAIPRARLTSGAHYYEFYYGSFKNVALVGDFVVPGVFADVRAILGENGGNPSMAMPPINRQISNASSFDGFKTDAACKVGTAIKVYGVKA